MQIKEINDGEKIKMRYSRKIYGLLLLIIALGLGTAATTPVVAQQEVPTYTYELHSDAKFKDGTTLTAHDVKWSFDRVISVNSLPVELIANMIYSTDVVDDTHVKFTLLGDFAIFEPVLSSAIGAVVKKDSVSVDEGADGLEGTIAWGTGPYRMTFEERDVTTVLERNPDYWGTPAKNKKVTIKYFASNALLATALEAGDIDVAHRSIDATKMKDWNENTEDDIETIMLDGGVTRYLVLPNETLHSRITSGIRNAIAYAVDRDAIVAGPKGGVALPIYTMVPSGWVGWYPTFPQRNLDKARELLVAEGYSEANPFELELWFSPTHYGTDEGAVAEVIKVALEETKMMKVTLKFVEWAEYLDKAFATEMETYLLGWYPDFIDTDNYMHTFYHSSGAASTLTQPDPPNLALDTLLHDARTMPDREIRDALYEQAQKIATEEAKVIPLWAGVQFAAWKDYVSDVLLGPDTAIRFYNIQKGATTDGELIVGTTDKIVSLDYADTYDHWSWLMTTHTSNRLLRYKEGTTELEYMLATGPPTIGRAIIGIETVITTMPITTIITTVVSEFGSVVIVASGVLILSVMLKASRRKRN